MKTVNVEKQANLIGGNKKVRKIKKNAKKI